MRSLFDLRARYLVAMGIGVTTLVSCGSSERGAGSPDTVVIPPIAAPVEDAGATIADDDGGAAHKPSREVRAFPPEPACTGRGGCMEREHCQAQAAEPIEKPFIRPYHRCEERAAGGTFSLKHTREKRREDPTICCYVSTHYIIRGRPIRVGDTPRVAAGARRDDWRAGVPVGVADLPAGVRARLAAHWEQSAALEHASVASFSRFSMEMMALGAPADLIAGAHAAALDEIEHARLSYALAAAYGDSPRGPGPLDLSGIAITSRSFVEMVTETFLDGCLNETIAAVEAREAAAACEDDGVRRVLATIAEDEARHAELAWRSVAWMLREGGDAARERLREVVEGARAGRPAARAEERGEDGRHGVLGEGEREAIAARVLDEVVLPCARALIARHA